MGPFRILLADNHPIFRLGLRSLLSVDPGWQICGEALDGQEAVEKCRLLRPHLLILDICLPRLNGVDAARQILKENPELQILVVTDINSEQVISESLDAGIRGWVFKSDSGSELTRAVELLLRRKSFFSPLVSDLIMDGYLKRHGVASISTKAPGLSPREREVVQLLSEGKTSNEIAGVLSLSRKTVETHRSNIMIKLKVHSVAEIVLYAVRNGIIRVKVPSVLLSAPPNGNGHAGIVPIYSN